MTDEEKPKLKEKKRISTFWGSMIILATAIILFGGAYTWGNYGNVDYFVTDYGINLSRNSNSNANLNVNVNANANANTNSATAGWKTYTNDTYGFSFKYPKDWAITSDTLVTTDPNTRKELNFTISNNETAQALINFEGGFEGASFYRKGEVKNHSLNIIIKEDWTQNEESDANQVVLFVENISSNAYAFNLIYNYQESNKSAVSLFDTILTTFQFTN